MNKKFKAVEKKAKVPGNAIEDIQWEGEEVQAQSETKLEADKGSGSAVVLRFFDFGANKETFKAHKPTAQELFNSHIRGIESLLWGDGLKIYQGVQPRLLFSKDGAHYRFIITCLPAETLIEKTKTLSELLR